MVRGVFRKEESMEITFGRKTKLFSGLINKDKPDAFAVMKGSSEYPDIHGKVSFFSTAGGVLAVTEVFGLPKGDGVCQWPVFGYHIHEAGSCHGNAEDPFADAGAHYNPNGCPHPYHAGDMPPLFGNNGYAWSAFFTKRFTVKELSGKSVIIHALPDDFKTQPAGAAGTKFACGKIV